jgi:YVTN family beta-propeller protein
VWVANSLDDTVARIDAASGEVVATIPVGGTPAAVTVGDGAVWVAESTGGRVSWIDPDSNEVVGSIAVGNGPRAIAASTDSVWVANSLDGTVSRLDVATDAVGATIQVGAGANGVAVSGDDVWVTNEYDASLSRVDARTSIVSTIDLGNAPAGAAILAGSLWVAASGAPSSHRGGTLRIASTGPGLPESADPSLHGTESPIWPLVYDTLVGYKRVGGVDGSTLVPDLAVSIPTPTDGGLTYTFKLRPGIVYSDGSPVRAEDVRHSLERVFRMAPDVASFDLSGIVGGKACANEPASCDLSDGVAVSGNDTVSVHLAAPDPDFLYRMASPSAIVIPSDAPDSDIGTHPLPGTGPYMIEELVPGNHVTLVRNPGFREWSRAAQPDGFPDRIEWTVVADGNAGVDDVEAGRIDLFGTNEDLPAARRDEIFTRFTSQAHSYAFTGPWAMFLNTRVRPFDDVRVRRALAFAIDRKEIQRRYPGSSAITCQAIPPNYPGYQPSCPYTVSPDAAGTWTAPDIAKARGLVEASGTKGTSITVWSFKGFAAVSEYFAAVLNDLGYRATMKVIGGDDFYAFYQFIANSKNRAQAGGFWLTGGPPLPSDLFRALGATCDSFRPNDDNNGNVSEFCDPGLDELFAKAVALQVSDPVAARGAWSELDRRISDLEPFIPVVVPEGVDFLSKRTGNYQHNPAYGILLAQVWVT